MSDAEDTSPGLSLSVDGKVLGAPPISQSLPPGEHVVRIEGTGFEGFEQRITLSPGQSLDLDPQLVAKNRRAIITLGTNASGAKIESIVGTTRQTLKGPPYALDIDPTSETKVVASKPGFKDVELALAFAPNESQHEFVINFDAAPTTNVPLKRGAPKVRMGAPTISGRLPAEVIQRIVRQNFGRFRACYEQGLARNPNLAGRVTVRFVIGREGAASNASNGGSDLPDSGVVSCIVSAFHGLSFPQPEGGIVTVAYPIMLSSG